MARKSSASPAGWFPKRGEVCLFALDKRRPAMVVSSDALNRHSLDVCVVPISTVEQKAFTLRPPLRAGEGGLDRDSWAKCDQVTTVEKSRAVYPPLGTVREPALEKIGQAIKLALELP
ncbi:MAG: type II toxin-antitoxin system PemK/MazF family toxin [Bryobacteraceae bacterium]